MRAFACCRGSVSADPRELSGYRRRAAALASGLCLHDNCAPERKQPRFVVVALSVCVLVQMRILLAVLLVFNAPAPADLR